MLLIALDFTAPGRTVSTSPASLIKKPTAYLHVKHPLRDRIDRRLAGGEATFGLPACIVGRSVGISR